jgi:hypothetical protein
LKPVQDGWNVVIVGAWNVAILNPDWVAINVFNREPIKLEVQLGPSPFASLRISNGLVRMVGAPDRVVLTPLAFTDEALSQVERAATRLLELLLHTPVAALGVNFAFIDDDPDDKVKAHFGDPAEGSLIGAGFAVEAHTLTRHLKKRDGLAINLKARWDAKSLRLDVNCHHEAGTAEAARKALEGKVVAYRDDALSVITNVYGLSVEELNGK